MTNTNSKGIIGGTHHDLSGRYGCAAYMTVATFILCGIVHRARRLFRSDLAGTGKIEVYTIEPYDTGSTATELGWYETTTHEDFLRYADPKGTSKLDRAATLAIMMAEPSLVGDAMSERYAAVEF